MPVVPERVIRLERIGLTMLTVAEAAAQLGVPTRRVQDLLKEGTLSGVKVSRRWRVARAMVVELSRSDRLRGRSRRLDPRYRRLASARAGHRLL